MDERYPSLFKCPWWTKELTLLKKQQNWLSGKAFRFQAVRDHPVHNEYKAAMIRFKEVMQETRVQDWMDWLKATSQWDLYIANQYILKKPTDYSSAHVGIRKITCY